MICQVKNEKSFLRRLIRVTEFILKWLKVKQKLKEVKIC
jgi:hypothetical protein